MVRLFLMCLIAFALLNGEGKVSLAEELATPVFVRCRATATGLYGIKVLNIWLRSADLVTVSLNDLFSLTDDFVRDERQISEWTVFNIKNPDITMGEIPIPLLKMNTSLVKLISAGRTTSPYAIAARSRKVVGQVRLLDKQMKEVVYDCREP